MRLLTLIAAICCCSSVVLAEDWPQFRGPGSQGAARDKNLPVKWNDDDNMVWKTKLPGAGASSPIAIGNRFYLTCYSGYDGSKRMGKMDDLRLHLVCVNREDGKIIFDKKVEPTLPESERVRDHGYAAATPACDGKGIYVFFGKSGVMRFDMEGNLKWRQSVGSKTHKWGCGTSPVLYGNVVIVNASVESGCLVGLSKETGKELWRAEGMQRSWNTPHLVKVGDKHELVVSVKDRILAYDPESGRELWTCEGIHDYVCPSIISKDGVIYAIGGRQSQCIAIRAGGKGNVTESRVLWRINKGANVSSPVIHDKHLYWVSDRNKVAYCVRLEDGEVVYEERVPSGAQPYASTVVADGKLYVVTRNNGTLVMPARPKFEILAHNKLSDQATFNASPIVASGKLILRSDAYLYSIGQN